MIANAKKTHCLRGHPLEGDNLYMATNGTRRCIECQKQHSKNKRRKAKDAGITPKRKQPIESTKEKARMRALLRVFDPKKLSAQRAVKTAIRAGRLVRWPVCAVPECTRTKVEGHHADYDNPLGVTWLCTSHHRLAHNLIREET